MPEKKGQWNCKAPLNIELYCILILNYTVIIRNVVKALYKNNNFTIRETNSGQISKGSAETITNTIFGPLTWPFRKPLGGMYIWLLVDQLKKWFVM